MNPLCAWIECDVFGEQHSAVEHACQFGVTMRGDQQQIGFALEHFADNGIRDGVVMNDDGVEIDLASLPTRDQSSQLA